MLPVAFWPSGSTRPVTGVYPTGRAARVLKSTIETLEPVSESALRNARDARRTFSAFEPIEPDSSSTRMTLIPHFGGRLGLLPGAVTLRASSSTFAALDSPPLQSCSLLAQKLASYTPGSPGAVTLKSALPSPPPPWPTHSGLLLPHAYWVPFHVPPLALTSAAITPPGGLDVLVVLPVDLGAAYRKLGRRRARPCRERADGDRRARNAQRPRAERAMRRTLHQPGGVVTPPLPAHDALHARPRGNAAVCAREPTRGLEPRTPSLPWRCSTS